METFFPILSFSIHYELAIEFNPAYTPTYSALDLINVVINDLTGDIVSFERSKFDDYVVQMDPLQHHEMSTVTRTKILEWLSLDFDIAVNYNLLDGGSVDPENYQVNILHGVPITVQPRTVNVNGQEITYNFLHWEDGNTENPRTFYTSHDVSHTVTMKAHLVTNFPSATGPGNQRRVAVDYDWVGPTYHAVYESGGHIWHIRNRRGAGWEPERQVSLGVANATEPSVTTYSWGHEDQILVQSVWVVRNGANGGVVYRRSNPDNGLTWRPTVTSVPSSRAANPIVIGYPGAVIWAEGHPTYSGIYYYKSVEENTSYVPLLVPGTSGNASHPAACWSPAGGFVYQLVFIRDGGVYYEEFIDPAPGDWLEPPELYSSVIELTTPGFTGTNPSIVSAGSSGSFVVWEETDGVNHRVAFRQRDVGGSWSPTVYFTHSPHHPTSPSVAIESWPSNAVNLLWQCDDHIARVSRRISGSLWTAVSDLGSGKAPNTVAATSSQQTTAFWTNGITAPYSITITELPSPQFEQWKAGWNMAGISVRVPDYAPSEVFPDAVPGTVYWSDCGAYSPVTGTCDSNRGFWVKFPLTPPTWPITYTGTFIDSMAMPVCDGWNMIGSISVPVDTAAVQYSSPAMRESNFFEYNAGYVIATSLKPGLGYWVKSAQAGYMILENGAICPTEPEAPPPKDKFAVTDSEGNRQELYVVNTEVSPEEEGIEMPPSHPEFDARWESGDLQITVEPTGEPIELPVALHQAAFPIMLEWELDPENQLQYTMIPPDSGGLNRGYNVVEVSGKGQLSIATGVNRIVLLASQHGSPLPKPLPTTYALAQNYPNPFNPSTIIKYDLPGDTRVTLKLYDVLGREVMSLVDGFVSAGYHHIALDGFSLSSGVYLYRLDAGSFSQVRKLVLLK